MTGDVSTHFWDNAQGAHSGLPTGSMYEPLKPTLEAMMKGQTNPPGKHSRQRWAKEVVDDLLTSSPPWHVRKGYLAITMWLVSWLVPYWVLDYLYGQVSELSKLPSSLHESKKTQ